MRITLLRHGKPKFDWKLWIRAKDIIELVKLYDSAGIVDIPPKEAILLIENKKYIVCSELPRSLQSAKALGVKKIDASDAIYREMSIPYFDGGSIKLPVTMWAVVLRALWFLGFSKNTESLSIAKKRAKLAAKNLIDLAEKHETILLVGHGFLDYYIAKELFSKNWQGTSKTGKRYWEYSTYYSS